MDSLIKFPTKEIPFKSHRHRSLGAVKARNRNAIMATRAWKKIMEVASRDEVCVLGCPGSFICYTADDWKKNADFAINAIRLWLFICVLFFIRKEMCDAQN